MNSISLKKEKFRKEIRQSSLHNYMNHIRTQIQDNKRFEELMSIIQHTSVNSQAIEIQIDCKKSLCIHQDKLKRLIQLANLHETGAIIHLATCILNRQVDISIFDDSEEVQESKQNGLETQIHGSDKYSSKNPLKNKIKLKYNESSNEAWLILIRTFVQVQYCTQNMIKHCISTIIRSNKQIALDYALQVLITLIYGNNFFKITNVFNTISSLTNSHNSIRIQNFIYKIMKISLNSYQYGHNTHIKYYSTKLLSLIIKDSQTNRKLVKQIPLKRLSQYLNQRFLQQQPYYKRKTFEMLSNLLISLTNETNQFKLISNFIFDCPIQRITRELFHLLNEQQIRKQQSLGFYHNLHRKEYEDHKIQRQNLKFIEQALFFMAILIDQFVCLNTSIQFIIHLFQALRIDQILIQVYTIFHRNAIDSAKQNDQQELSCEQLIKKSLVHQAKLIVQKIINQFIVFDKLINQQNSNSKEQINKFSQLRLLATSRFKRSHLRFEFMGYFNGMNSNSQIEI